MAPNVGGQRAMEAKAMYNARVADYKIDGVCQRCHDIILSKKQVGKYRPLRTPAKCAGCSQKAVYSAYNTYCNHCANSRRICCRCGDKRSEYKGNKEADNELRRLTALLEEGDLNERQRRSTLRKIEKAKEARRDAAKTAREERAMAKLEEHEMAKAARAGHGPDDSDEEDEVSPIKGGSHQVSSTLTSNAAFAFTPDAPLAFNFSIPPTDSTTALHTARAPDDGAALEAGDAATIDVSPPTEISASVSTSDTKSHVIPELMKDAAAVDAAFAGAWGALLQVVSPAHVSGAEEAFDALSNALGESAADKMSDAVAATVAEAAAARSAQLKSSAEDDTNDQHEAVTTLAMLREALRWRANGSSRTGDGYMETQDAAESAAEAAARVLHQLLTMSRSWGSLNRWVGGMRA